jgi:hypothetical protein
LISICKFTDNHQEKPSYTDYTGDPIIEKNNLVAIVRLLYMAQPLVKGILSRIFLNLCANNCTRDEVLSDLLAILCSYRATLPLIITDSGKFSPISEPHHPLVGYRIGGSYAVQVLCSFILNLIFCLQICTKQPPRLVITRLLEILVHISRNHLKVSESIAHSKIRLPFTIVNDDDKGKEEETSTSSVFSEIINLIGIDI